MEDNDRSMRSLIVRYLVARTQCSGCGERYEPNDVHIYDHRGDMWLASVTCGHCGLQGLIMASIRSEDMGESEETYSEPTEQQLVSGLGPITEDEVLDFHDFIDRFTGDMKQLFDGVEG